MKTHCRLCHRGARLRFRPIAAPPPSSWPGTSNAIGNERRQRPPPEARLRSESQNRIPIAESDRKKRETKRVPLRARSLLTIWGGGGMAQIGARHTEKSARRPTEGGDERPNVGSRRV